MNRLADTLTELNIPYNDETLKRFSRYMEIVLDWNEKVNLTAITDRDEFIEKHFIDSVVCLQYAEAKAARRIIDVGTGAGFPGIPLAILSPDKEFTLLDSLAKRIKILGAIVEALSLSNVTLLHSRAEDAARDTAHREQYGLCVSRAVAALPVLLEYCLPFVAAGGSFFAYKGADCEEEVACAGTALRLLGGGAAEVRRPAVKNLTLPHGIVVITKAKSTPRAYPRKAGTPAKQPL